MKNYRRLVPIVLIVVLAMSWYKLLSTKFENADIYNEYLQTAREYAESGVTKYAMEYYNLALSMNENIDLYIEIGEYYKGQGKTEEYLTWAEQAMVVFPTDAKAYDAVLEANFLGKDYDSCYDVIEVAEKRGISSEYLIQVQEEIAYYYKMDFNNYDNVSIYSNNYCAVQDEGFWGFVDRYGNLRVGCKYPNVGAYTKSNFVSVINKEGIPYFIDKSGSKVIALNENVARAGLLVGDMIAVQMKDGTYTYINQSGENVMKSEDGTAIAYEYASTMNSGIAAVKINNAWMIIDATGKQIVNTTFTDVKLDEKEIVVREDRMFVQDTDGLYIMIDSTGKQIGNLKFEDARLFSAGKYAAVKTNGKWAFIDVNGKLISDKTYDDARSFSNGLAAVCINGKWGFIDENEVLRIESIFDGASDFNEKGSCFVKNGNTWQLLKLYRLNREG